jgi:diguanylate cyclase (GGDEF)-like protein/PAS domain S-box-containing protein
MTAAALTRSDPSTGVASAPTEPELRVARQIAARTHALLTYVDEVVTVSDAAGMLVYVSPSARAVFGCEPEELVARRSIPTLAHPSDAPRLHGAWRRAVASAGTTITTTLRGRHRSGQVLHLEASLTSLLHDPAVEGVVVNLRDVTARRASERALARHALHDALTGLPNRTLLLDRMHQALDRRASSREQLAVMFIDLDGFKAVNDSLGHAAGDELLVEMAHRLAAVVAPGDTVARLAGDEFVVLAVVGPGGAALAGLRSRVLRAVTTTVRMPTGGLRVTASIGMVVADGGHGPDDLLADADAAMYLAKELGGARCEVFDPAVHRREGGRLTTEGALRRAIEYDELRLAYQPAFDVHTRSIVGVEALVRWRHPHRGIIDPMEFVPFAEETGLIVPLGAWVLDEACATAARWAQQPGERRVWVNIAAPQLADADLPGTVKRALERAGLSPDRLGVELTETALLCESEPAVVALEALHVLGVAVALDDFGTGYSSLSYLHQFPVDVVKIDRSFVAGVGRDERTATLVGGVVAMAHALGMVVVAEGVESADELATLRTLGCDVAQGNFLTPPVPLDALGDVLAAGDACRRG